MHHAVVFFNCLLIEHSSQVTNLPDRLIDFLDLGSLCTEPFKPVRQFWVASLTEDKLGCWNGIHQVRYR